MMLNIRNSPSPHYFARFSTWTRVLVLSMLSFVMSGCAIVTDVRGGTTRYHLYEHDQHKLMYGADGHWVFLAPLPVEAGMLSVLLHEHQVSPLEFWQGWFIWFMPRQRNVNELFELAQSTSPVWQMGQDWPKSAKIHWILGNDPLVIAIGTDEVPVRVRGGGQLIGSSIELGETYALVGDDDLQKNATELVILDHWPSPWNNTGSEWEKQFRSDLEKVRRIIKLDHATPLSKIMEEKVWMKK